MGDVKLHFIRYWSMNSWNRSKTPAFNLKVYKVIPNELQNKVFEMMESEDFYYEINDLVGDFNREHNYSWQASFNGRSGGYLILHKGGIENKRVFVTPGKDLDFVDVPNDILASFKQLAVNIVETVIDLAKSKNVVEEEYTVTKTRKVLV